MSEEPQPDPSQSGWEVVTSYQRRPIKKRSIPKLLVGWMLPPPKKRREEQAARDRLQA